MKARRYIVEYCWKEHYGGPQPRETQTVDAYTAEDAVFQFMLEKGKEYWLVTKVVPAVEVMQ